MTDATADTADGAMSQPREDMFATLADNISQLAWMADSSGSVFWYNRRWFEFTGSTLDQMKGWGWTKVHHPDHVERVVDRIRRCFESGEPWEDTFPLRGANGDYRWFLSRATPIRGDDGQIVRWLGTNTDVTEQRQVDERLRESEATFRAMFNNSSLGKAQAHVASYRFTRVNDGLCRLVGARATELLAASLPDYVHPSSRPALQAGLARLARGEINAFDIEARLETVDKRRVWAQITLNTIVDEKGAPYRLAAVFVDATERKKAEQRNFMLMREVNHRAKNLLAIVQAIARQTVGSEDFEPRFLERVSALAAAHDVIVDNEWQGATLERLILSQTNLFADPQSRRIALSGPAVLVSADASQMLAMTIYELATNAMKHGALSCDGGRVDIEWSVSEEADAPTFSLGWRESGGPPAAKPKRTGFGSVVTRRLSASMFDAKVEANYAPEGFVWRLNCPLGKIVGQPASDLESVAG